VVALFGKFLVSGYARDSRTGQSRPAYVFSSSYQTPIPSECVDVNKALLTPVVVVVVVDKKGKGNDGEVVDCGPAGRVEEGYWGGRWKEGLAAAPAMMSKPLHANSRFGGRTVNVGSEHQPHTITVARHHRAQAFFHQPGGLLLCPIWLAIDRLGGRSGR
jgi:hypothetical protein